uniref:Alpha-methylacyl-CoA racemase n=1 Tax=Caligus rogercresseyi TaxID=217165 RepID=C1BN74_CALRO|nr:Alpha-methylacyl-CoA racemase [Caligus rogercresseyi]
MALRGVCVIELAGLAAAPFTSMILADYGASVIRIDNRPGSVVYPDYSCRGKKSLSLDLKHPKGRHVLKQLACKSDVLLESFRPGVMEKLQLGPEFLIKENPGLIYARLSGYGQKESPMSQRAGHDINYISLSGALSKFGRAHDNPIAPVNIVGDFAGGGLTCAFGILAALFERANDAQGRGQIIDCGMTQGASYLSSWLYQTKDSSVLWGKPRGHNMLDTGAHFYEVYETKEPGKYVAVGAIEPQFYSILLEKLELSPPEDYPQFDANTEKLKGIFASKFRTKTREEWTKVFKDVDACVTPVLDVDEAPFHELSKEYFTSTESGQRMSLPAPSLSRTPANVSKGGFLKAGQHTRSTLRTSIGMKEEDIDELLREGVVFEAS